MSNFDNRFFLQDHVERVDIVDTAQKDFSLQISVEMPYEIRTIHSPTNVIKLKVGIIIFKILVLVLSNCERM